MRKLISNAHFCYSTKVYIVSLSYKQLFLSVQQVDQRAYSITQEVCVCFLLPAESNPTEFFSIQYFICFLHTDEAKDKESVG